VVLNSTLLFLPPSFFNLISAVGVDAGAQDIEMPKFEGGEGFIDKVIKPRRLKALAHKRLRYPRRIQLLNLGFNLLFLIRSFL
jgi:hypothetical protein